MTRSRYYVLASALAAAFGAHAASYLPFFYDDSFISLRYAERFLHGDGLTWTAGERVEGYSDLLWVLLCAGLGALGIDLVDAARGLGIASVLATMAAIAHRGRTAPWAGLLALAFVAASGSIAVWSVAGLEATLLGALIAWGTTLLLASSERDDRRTRIASGVMFALAALTRPDGMLFASGGIVLFGMQSRRTRVVELAAPTLVAVLGQLAFRWLYYADVVPNSAHVKLALTASRAMWGAYYLGAGLLEAGGLVVLGGLALATCAGDRTLRPRVVAIAVPLGLWCLYLVSIGGDPIPARRHFVPIVVLLALAIVEAGRAIAAGTITVPRGRGIAASVGLLAVFVGAQLWAPEITQVRDEHWEWQGRTLGRLLQTAFGADDPLVAVDPAGCVPYYSRLRSLDMLGLNDRHIGSAPVTDFGGGPIGHERGDGAYVLSRAPDLVLFCGPEGARRACFRSGRQMEHDPRFLRDYRPIVLTSDRPRLRSVLFARLSSEAIGMQGNESLVRIPAYFFADGSPHVAASDAHGTLVLRLAPHVPVTLHRVPMPARGAWIGEVTQPGVTIRVPSVYATPDGLYADVVLSAARPTELEEIRLTR